MSSSRRRPLVAVLHGLGIFLVLDGVVVEPHELRLTSHAIVARVDAPLRLVHVSELHTHGFGSRERRLVELVGEAQPDSRGPRIYPPRRPERRASHSASFSPTRPSTSTPPRRRSISRSLVLRTEVRSASPSSHRGASILPVRLFCPAEVALVEIRPER
jgi:hypothetical protein